MKKFLLKIWGDRKGSALIVALLVMGVFMAVSLVLSSLIFRELRVTRDLLQAGRAYYAAEAGIEKAMYFLDKNLPGWEKESEEGLSEQADFDYRVKNTCYSYPCFDEEEYDLTDPEPLPEAFYDVLELNENIMLPLFTVNENGEVDSIEDFTVEFFAAFNPQEDLKIDNIAGWDVLRWKIFGMNELDNGNLVTESISDFTAISAAHTGVGDDPFANADQPSWFGSVSCEGQTNRLVDSIYCPQYSLGVFSQAKDQQICTNTQARDHYFYVNGEVTSIESCYPIKNFMQAHQADFKDGQKKATGLNYLSLTNLMNPSMFRDQIDGIFLNQEQKRALSRIYFRVETYEDKMVREYANITANGYSGDMKQSINVKLKRGSYMPVFNFSIYSTAGSEDYY
jgi:hypothetical protein